MATTPILALPYPVGTDRVMDGDNAMQALAERVEAIHSGMPYGEIYQSTQANMAHTANTSLGNKGNSSTVSRNLRGGMTTADVSGQAGSNPAGSAYPRLIVPVAGIYLVTAAVVWSANSNGVRYLSVQRNATNSGGGGTIITIGETQADVGNNGIVVSCLVVLAAGNSLTWIGYQSSGVTITTLGADLTVAGTANSTHIEAACLARI